jgi:hypothetical protein
VGFLRGAAGEQIIAEINETNKYLKVMDRIV